jgi:Ca2+/H+ antiporter, TMEM165/GDT1 family
MEALVPALVLALLTQLGEPPALLVAALADRFARPLTVALAAAVALALGQAAAALGGALVGPALTPAAGRLLLAAALVLAGLGGLWPVRAPGAAALPPPEAWRLGPVLTPFLAVLLRSLGDRSQLLTFAIAAGGAPGYAAAGASLGALLPCLAAALLGGEGWRAVPWARIRLAVAVLLLTAGLGLGLAALGLW